MGIMIINKILMIILIMSILNVGRHLFFIFQIMTKKEEERDSYKLDLNSILILGLSVSFIVTSIFTGINL